MLDHLAIQCADLSASADFYDAALRPLGAARLMDFGVAIGYGVPPKPDFWMAEGEPQQPRIHIAFRADSRQHVDEFYRAALAAGGKDNGPPGPRPHYHANYYGAFVIDPDGHNIEAVCHDPQP